MKILELRKDTSGAWETFWQTGRTGFFLFLMLFVVWPSISRQIESFDDLSNSITPDFHVVEGWRDWFVIYRVITERPVRANFILQTRSVTGVVRCTYVSENKYNYTDNVTSRKIWTWDGWAETYNPGSCDVPRPPFQLCLRYEGITRLGNPFDTSFTCIEFTQTRTTNSLERGSTND